MTWATRATVPDLGDASAVDADAVDAVAMQAHAAARQIVRQYGAFVWRTLRYQGVAERDLEDVSQEVFIIIFQKLAQLERSSSIRAWIYGISIRVAAGYRRRHRIQHEVLVDEVPDLAGPADSGEADRLHARRQLAQIIARLDEEKRAVFVLHELEHLEMAEIAEIVGCPVATGYSRLAAAKKQALAMLSRMSKESK